MQPKIMVDPIRMMNLLISRNGYVTPLCFNGWFEPQGG